MYNTHGEMTRWDNAPDPCACLVVCCVVCIGLGTNAHSLSLGCDCLGHIHYLDAHLGPTRRTYSLIMKASHRQGITFRARQASYEGLSCMCSYLTMCLSHLFVC